MRRIGRVAPLSGVLFGLVVWCLALGPVRADDTEDIRELRQRMEALEKQNQELMKMLLQKQQQDTAEEADNAAPQQEDKDTEKDKDKADKDKVKKIVGDYIKEKDEEKKKKDDEEKKKLEAEGWEVGKHLGLSARFDNAYWYLESPDKAFRFHVGGRIQPDILWMAAPDRVKFEPLPDKGVEDGVNFRRARLEVDGTLWENCDFWVEMDFENTNDTDFRDESVNFINTPVPTDVWVTFTHIPWLGNCRVGNQKPPISLEHLTSSRFLDFMERSYCFDAFIGGLNNGFTPGIQFFNWFADERATWALGVFRYNDNLFGWNFGDGEWAVTGRMTGLPIYANDGRVLMHLGLGAQHRTADENQLRYRARTLLRNGPASAQTVMSEIRLDGESESMLVPEFLFQVGPFFIQSEYYAVWGHDVAFPHDPDPGVDQITRGGVFYQGAYVQALYFLTGEHRIYNRRYRENRRLATFDRVIPDENAFCVRGNCGQKLFGRGAWQVGARYSWIDLTDGNLSAGIVHGCTLGLNWFLNPNMKIQWNYNIEHRNMPLDQQEAGFGDATVHGFGTRLAFDF